MRKRDICSAIASGVLAINCIPMTTMAMTEPPKAAEQQTEPQKEDTAKPGEENKGNKTKQDNPQKPDDKGKETEEPTKPTDKEDKPTQGNPQKPDDKEKPEEELKVINLIIKQDVKSPKGADVDFFALIEKATNSKGVDISKLVKIDAGNFDKEKPGVYEIKYSYTDKDGKVTERITKVTVVDDKKTPANMPNTGDSNSAIYATGLLSSILAIFGVKKAKERE